jgi:hypothetical protein
MCWKHEEVSVEKLHGKKPIGRPRCRWEDNIRAVRFGGADWVHLAQHMDYLGVR